MPNSLTIKLSNHASLCRLCLKANLNDDFKDIGNLAIPGRDVSLRRILISLCKVTLHEYPSLCHHVWRTCFTAIKHMILFIKDVADNQCYLLNLLNSTSESTKELFPKNEGVNIKLASHNGAETNDIAGSIVRRITRNSNKYTSSQKELENNDVNEITMKTSLHSHTTSSSSRDDLSQSTKISQASFLQNCKLSTSQNTEIQKNQKPIN